jgi:hypothetical protein
LFVKLGSDEAMPLIAEQVSVKARLLNTEQVSATNMFVIIMTMATATSSTPCIESIGWKTK